MNANQPFFRCNGAQHGQTVVAFQDMAQPTDASWTDNTKEGHYFHVVFYRVAAVQLKELIQGAPNTVPMSSSNCAFYGVGIGRHQKPSPGRPTFRPAPHFLCFFAKKAKHNLQSDTGATRAGRHLYW